MPVISILGRQIEEEFEANLSYIAKHCLKKRMNKHT
jgi:hypothetical protein